MFKGDMEPPQAEIDGSYVSDNIFYHFIHYFKRIAISHGSWASFERMEDGLNLLMSVLCIGIAGLGAGLTMGLLSLDQSKLEIKAMVGSPAEKLAAIRLLPIVKQHHSLLVTLLLTNSIASESLPIFLGEVVPNIYAVLLSVFCIFIFGEIFPTAFFTGPGQLLMAGRCHNIVKWMMWLLYPLTYPISSALDYLFSHDEHDSTISRAELSAMIALQSADHVSVLQTEGDTAIDIGTDTDIDAAARVHGNINTDQYGGVGVTLNERTPLKTPQVGHGHTHSHAHAHGRAPLMSPVTNNLKQTEVRIMTSILQLAGTTLRHALIPTAHTGTDSGAPATVFSLCGSTKLDRRTLLAISRTGYSRVPIYFEHRRRFVGYILTKSLLEVDPADCLPVASLPLRQPLVISPDVSLLHLLDLFKTGRCNIAFISNSPDLTVKYIQHKLQVESYLDQQCARSNSQSYSRAETEALGGPSSENRQHENSILSPVKHFSHNNTCVDSVDDTSLLDSHGKLSASDIVLARELNLLSGAETETAITNAAAALKSMEIVGIITLQDVLQKIFGGHHLHDSDSLQSGNKYTRVHTPVRSTVHHLSFSDDSINVSSSAFNSTNNSAVKVEHASDIVGCGGGSSSDVEQGQVLFTADTDQLLTKE